MKSKYELLNYLKELGYKKGAEIGVSSGYFSEKMFQAIPGLELWCVDSWRRYRGNRFDVIQPKHNIAYQNTVERLKPYKAHIIRKKSTEAMLDIVDSSLNFVYIDANHGYDYVMEDIIGWTRKVRVGGMIIGDDYYLMKKAGVVEAVNDYVKYHNINLKVIDPRPYKIIDRNMLEQPTYYWIKE
jgi:hypothetical protein